MMNHSIHFQCCVDRLEQVRIAEWFGQAIDGASFEQARKDGVIAERGDEYDWDFLPSPLQFPLQIGSGHTRHGDVEEQTSGLADAIRRKELFRRGKRLYCETELPQQVG